MTDRELWRVVGPSGKIIRAVHREIRAAWSHQADGPFRLELRILYDEELHRSETFTSDRDLDLRSRELHRTLLEKGWHPVN